MRFRNVLLTSTALLALGSVPGAAGPDGPVVVGGTATITGAGTATTTINQTSNRAIINWNTFNIGAGETTTFVQPGSSSVALNRVTGGLGPSQIYGTLNANGMVFVINRDGVLVGPTGVINTAGFLASTNDINNADFMAGRYNFNIAGRPDASIVNQGRITAASGGFAALVAPGVRNSGTITATLGTVALASGNSFTLDLYGDKLIQLSPSDQIANQVIDVATGKPLASLVTNEGKLSANGGRVELTAAAARAVVDSVINTKGVIEANTVGTREGRIVLGAATGASKPAGAPKQTVKVSGIISASGQQKGTKGGTVVVTGEDIQVAGAKIDVSGDAGGGKVMLGGDWGGGNPTTGLVNNQSATIETYQIANATTLSVDATTTIDASAKTSGDGGKVVLWSDAQTTFAGTIFARGGDTAGNGGFVEVSGRQQLGFTGMVDTRAPNGLAGTLLLDPEDIVIGTGGTMTVATLEGLLANGNVVVATGAGAGNGDITVTDAVSWSSTNSLTLSAYRDIAVNANITNTGGAAVTLRADNTGTGVGTVSFGGGAQVSTAGAVSIFYNPTSYATPTDYASNVAGGGTLTAYMLVNTFANLQDINTNLAGTYALGRDINADNMAPIGSAATPFTGLLDGQGHTITNAIIAPTGLGDNAIGLFGAIDTTGTVRNLTLDNFQVSANPNVAAQFVGVLAGLNEGTIDNVHVTGGSVNGTGINGVVAGGLAGMSIGTIRNSSAAGATVSVGDTGMAGGLVGINAGTITTTPGGTITHASNNVTGGNNSFLGGFAGVNIGDISLAYATGNVAGGTSTIAGGFVGFNTGSINQTYARGAVTGGDDSYLGGFVGVNFRIDSETGPGSITQSYALGPVTGGNAVVAAAFAALNLGSLDQTYAVGRVTAGADSTTGGLVAANNLPFTPPTAGPRNNISYKAMDAPTITAITLPDGTATNSYWDRQSTGQSTSAGGTGLDTVELASKLPPGFDPSIWAHGSYPHLVNLGPQNTGPDSLPVLQQTSPVLLQINSNPINPPPPPPDLINTQLFNQQQQSQPGPQTPSINNPIQLDVGAGRYFFLPPPEETRLVKDEVVIQLPCNTPQQALNDALARLRFAVLNSQCLATSNVAIYRLRIGNGQTIADAIRSLAGYRIIVAGQANYLYTLGQDLAADRRQGDSGQYVLQKLHLGDIHRRIPATNVPIAVIDSEIDAAHPDLEGTVVDRYDATGVEEQPHSHGTGMAGAIASHRRLLGIAPGARLLAVRAFSVTAASAQSTTFNILKGLDYAVNNGARIVNMSFAGPRDPTIERALKTAYDKGVVLIAAAGNAGPKSPPLFPAADKHVIAVTATDIDDRLFNGANRGNYITVAAPGVDILVPAPQGTYQMTTGTSVATAHVSGIVALILERNPRLTPADVRRILTASAKRLGPHDQFGAGLIDPAKALQLAAPRSAGGQPR